MISPVWLDLHQNRWDKVGQTTGEQAGQAESSHLSHLHKSAVGHGKPLPIKAVPPVPPKKHIAEDFREAFEERAAVREFDGGLDRIEAERAAEDDLLVTINVRGLGRAEVRIPKTRADALALLELVEQFTDKATLQ